MDDLKTFAKDDGQQQGLLNIVKTFSSDIKMEFGLEKCAKATFKRRRFTSTSNIHTRQLYHHERTGARKNLQICGSERRRRHPVQNKAMKEKIRKKYYRQIRLILKTYLPTLPVFPGVSRFFIKSPDLPVRVPDLPDKMDF